MAKKALIAMSGGVDSSVAAYLMKEAGYDCIGVTMKLYDNEDIGMAREKTCCSLSDIEDARSCLLYTSERTWSSGRKGTGRPWCRILCNL